MTTKNTLSTAVAILIAAIVSAMATAVLITSTPTETAKVSGPTKQERIVHRTAIVRLGADGPYLHTDRLHAAVSVRRVVLAANGCDLRVIWKGKRGTERILAAEVDEDESVSALDVQAGYSGNIDKGTIKMHRDGVRVCANDPTFGSRANLWINITSIRN